MSTADYSDVLMSTIEYGDAKGDILTLMLPMEEGVGGGS